jgi:hypothetical protein
MSVNTKSLCEILGSHSCECYVTPCGLVEICRCLEGTYCLLLQVFIYQKTELSPEAHLLQSSTELSSSSETCVKILTHRLTVKCWYPPFLTPKLEINPLSVVESDVLSIQFAGIKHRKLYSFLLLSVSSTYECLLNSCTVSMSVFPIAVIVLAIKVFC